MSYRELGNAIHKVVGWLNDNNFKYALVGGLAVSFRTIERATKDIDFAIAVKDDTEAEKVIRSFQTLGFQPNTLLENKIHKIISTVRLLSEEFPGIFVDLLFSTSGIELEVVESAEPIDILPNLKVQVATTSSLIAMKILSSTHRNRRKDLLDLENLIGDAKIRELEDAAQLVKLIELRGFNNEKKLSDIYQNLLDEIRSE